MSKKIYLPTEEELYEIQKIKDNNDVNEVNVYAYLITKAIEKILVDRANGIPFSNMDDYILSIRDVIRGICWVYPKEIQNFEKIKSNDDLCFDLLTKEQDPSIYNLDYLAMFNQSESLNVGYFSSIMKKTINILNEKLTNSPEYRFEYQESELLDSIFSVEWQKFVDLPFDTFSKLMKIDPTYVLHYESTRFSDLNLPFGKDEKVMMNRKGIFLESSIKEILKRYSLSTFMGYDYQEIDITKTSNERIKRLKRFLTK